MSLRVKNSDFDIDFSKNEFTSDVSLKKEANSIRQSIRNLILTRKGERKFDRNFGVGLHDLLFENNDVLFLSILSRDIEEHMDAYEPRAFFDSIELNDDEIDSNTLSITLHYFIVSLTEENPQPDSLSISIQKIR
tara:strand:- start:8117 stop:8521 length:405 start_codon:yes stop_codon:yes gene_type:complete